ncbi:MAG: C69 family dipeptidase [Polyangiaceae bacterium]|nr:C69 family dipeptidase [Polyangiaceae bacterium]
MQLRSFTRFATCTLAGAASLFVTMPRANACTSFLVSKGASADGSTMITYAADSHELYGELRFRPAARHAPGAKREIRDWDTDKVLGEIDQVSQTFRVVGNMNEHQVVIGETTFGGREELKDPKGGIDYGSMIYVALERAKTAREAISVMTDLANEHGYFSTGETFSIADPNEVWLMDLIGKGPDNKGVVWVACRVPDGHVTAHANRPRIRTFPRNDPDTCVYAKDVVSFAKQRRYYDGPDDAFSFQQAYAPDSCEDRRMCDSRVWSFYNRMAPSKKLSSDYVRCKNDKEPLPLWIKPDKKLSVADLKAAMRDHFEDTPFDLRKDVGAGPYVLPYRWRPLTWKHDGKTYGNERATATQQTGFSFVSQSRGSLPGDIGGVLWFSVDDAASTVYVPMYAGIREAPKAYAEGTGAFTKFSWDSAFWVFNFVSNFTYLRYADMIRDVQTVQTELENGFLAGQEAIEREALALHKKSPEKASKFLTEYSTKSSEKVVSRWRDLGPQLLMKYMDGNVRDEKGKVTHPGYPKEWYARVVRETGDHFYLESAPDGGPGPAPAASPGASAPRSDTPPGRPGCAIAPAQRATGAGALALLALAALRRRCRHLHPMPCDIR